MFAGHEFEEVWVDEDDNVLTHSLERLGSFHAMPSDGSDSDSLGSLSMGFLACDMHLPDSTKVVKSAASRYSNGDSDDDGSSAGRWSPAIRRPFE